MRRCCETESGNNGAYVSPTARVYRGVVVVDSTVGDGCVIADDCSLYRSLMHERAELGRRSIVIDSEIGKGSYTGANSVVTNTVIGNYCSLSWNTSIGGGKHPIEHVSTYSDYWFQRVFGLPAPQGTVRPKTIIGSDVWVGAGANVRGGGKHWYRRRYRGRQCRYKRC